LAKVFLHNQDPHPTFDDRLERVIQPQHTRPMSERRIEQGCNTFGFDAALDGLFHFQSARQDGVVVILQGYGDLPSQALVQRFRQMTPELRERFFRAADQQPLAVLTHPQLLGCLHGVLHMPQHMHLVVALVLFGRQAPRSRMGYQFVHQLGILFDFTEIDDEKPRRLFIDQQNHITLKFINERQKRS
jgi:hypothetical protein